MPNTTPSPTARRRWPTRQGVLIAVPVIQSALAVAAFLSGRHG